MPMNFNAIGGSGGGGAGPLGTPGTGIAAGASGFRTGAGGGGFGLKRNRFRSAGIGLGGASPSARRCTSGTAGPASAARVPAVTGPRELDGRGASADVRGQTQ